MAEKRVAASPLDLGAIKKQKCSLREQGYKDAYGKTFPFISKSERGETFVFCSNYKCDINIGHGGVYDIMKHNTMQKHQRNSTSVANSIPIGLFFQRQSDLSATRAEVLYTHWLVETNTLLAAVIYTILFLTWMKK